MARCLRCKAGDEWIEGAARSETAGLTTPQINTLIAAAEFVKAGEWPWSERERTVLDRAVEKLHAMRGEPHG